MKNLRSILIALIISITFSTAFAKTTLKNFSDVDSEELYFQAIQFLYDNKIVKGYDDGTFKPQITINRAEMVKIITEAKLKYDNLSTDFLKNYSKKKCFSDVPTNQWFTKYVCYGKEKGWIIGYENGKYFKPANATTFVEGLKITFEGFDLSYVETSPVWYKGLVQTASVSNYIPFDIHDFNGKFKRNQMADLITRILKHKEGQQSLDDYLAERKEIIVSYETIEQELDLSQNQFEEKESNSEDQLQDQPQDQPDNQPSNPSSDQPQNDPANNPNIETKTTNPDTPFVYVNYLSMTDSSVEITIFDPLNDGGKPIKSYRVENLINIQPELIKILYKEGNPGNIFTLDGLKKDAEYVLVVKAINEDGLESKSGDIINITVSKSAGTYYFNQLEAIEKPEKPTISIIDQTSGYITLKITPPSKGNVEYYAIEINEGESYIPYKILYISDFSSVADFKNGGPITLSNLTANKNYDMRIRAITAEKQWSQEEVILQFQAAKNGFSSIK